MRTRLAARPERDGKPVFLEPRRFGQELNVYPDITRAPTIRIYAQDVGNFGSCSVPQIGFNAGFDGRKATSFQPANKSLIFSSRCFVFVIVVFQSHWYTITALAAAQDTDTISQFICDTFVNSCRVDQIARTTYASAAQAAAVKQTAMTSGQADAFDPVFGIKRDIAANTPPGDEPQGNQDTCTSSNHPGPANFGKWSTPEVKFVVGLDGRTETAPVDQGTCK